jgi:hypothetical protein
MQRTQSSLDLSSLVSISISSSSASHHTTDAFYMSDIVYNVVYQLRLMYIEEMKTKHPQKVDSSKKIVIPILKRLCRLSHVSQLWRKVMHQIIVSLYNIPLIYSRNDSLLNHFNHILKELDLSASSRVTNEGLMRPMKLLSTLCLYKNDVITGSVFQDSETLQTSLNRLILDDNRQVEGKYLQFIRNLRCLSLRSNMFITNEDVQKLTNLDTLFLVNNVNIDASAIECLPNITQLNIGVDNDFYNHMYDDDDDSTILRHDFKVFDDNTLSRLTHLKHLKISSYDKPARFIQKVIGRTPLNQRGHIEEHQEMIQRWRRFQEEIDRTIVAATLRCAQNALNVADLEIGRHHDLYRVLESLKRSASATPLTFPIVHSFTDNGLVHLKDTLNSLTITGNTSFTDHALSQCTNLTELSLKYNKVITDNGLKGLTKMKKLCLSYNYNITNEGLSHVSNSLTSLSLKENYAITDETVKTLTNLKVLNLYANRTITYDGCVQHLMKTLDLILIDRKHAFLLDDEYADRIANDTNETKICVVIKKTY